jgi:hypothetical protein
MSKCVTCGGDLGEYSTEGQCHQVYAVCIRELRRRIEALETPTETITAKELIRRRRTEDPAQKELDVIAGYQNTVQTLQDEIERLNERIVKQTAEIGLPSTDEIKKAWLESKGCTVQEFVADELYRVARPLTETIARQETHIDRLEKELHAANDKSLRMEALLAVQQRQLDDAYHEIERLREENRLASLQRNRNSITPPTADEITSDVSVLRAEIKRLKRGDWTEDRKEITRLNDHTEQLENELAQAKLIRPDWVDGMKYEMEKVDRENVELRKQIERLNTIQPKLVPPTADEIRERHIRYENGNTCVGEDKPELFFNSPQEGWYVAKIIQRIVAAELERLK